MLQTDMELESGGRISSFKFRDADVFIIRFDVTFRETMTKCERWLWELHKVSSDKSVVVAVGNKIDLANRRQVSNEEAQAYFAAMDPPLPYFEISAKTGEGVNELFESVAKMLLEKRATDLQLNENSCDDKDVEDSVQKKNGKCIVC